MRAHLPVNMQHGRFSALCTFVLLMIASLLASPLTANAGTACCACRAPGQSETSCLTIDDTKLGIDVNSSRADPADPCRRLPSVVGDSLKGWTCEPPSGQTSTLLPSKCLAVADGGVCQTGKPQNAYTAGVAPSETKPASAPTTNAPPIIPNLNVEIPGFAFTGSAVTEDTSSLLAQYIAGLYRFGVSIAAIAATVMFTWGAFLYLLGSAIPSIHSGKGIMIDAVFGMILVLTAHMLLRTINPETLTLKALYIKGVDPYAVGQYRYDVIPEQSQLEGLTGKPANAEEMIIQGANLVAGVDPCLVLAICYNESRLQPLWSGQLSGGSAEKATAWGPCQQSTRLLTGTSYLTLGAQRLFADFPAPVTSGAASERIRMGQYLNNNYVAAGYLAALNLQRGMAAAGNNELAAAAGYYSGSVSLRNWQRKSGCRPKAGTVRGGVTMTDACIPDLVGVQVRGFSNSDCPEDGYVCSNAKVDQHSQFVGTCSDGRKCFAAKIGPYVRRIPNTYKQLASRHTCTISAQDAVGTISPSTFQNAGSGKLQANDRILIIGDSLSQGLTGPLQALAQKDNHPFGSGPGVQGSFTGQWAPGGSLNSRLTNGLNAKPQVVLVVLGTNDAYSANLTSDTFNGQVSAIIQQIEAAGARYYWIGPPDLPDRYGNNTQQGMVIPALKARIPSDRYFASDNNPIPRGPDNLHPTPPGYSQWAASIWNWLR
jgi:lysophospholipase L1-like esterase